MDHPSRIRPGAEYMGTRAGVVTRTLAAAIDLGTIVMVVLSLYFAIAGIIFVLDPRDFQFPQISPIWLFLAGEVLLFVYLAVGWMNTGRSVGKQLMGLRVVDSRARTLRPSRAVVRAAFCTLIPIGLFWSVIDPKNRAAHDIFLGTIVLYDWSARPPPVATPA